MFRRGWLPFLLATILATSLIARAEHGDDNNHGKIRHVLLISIDGMHSLDFQNCAAGVNGGAPYCPTLAALGKNGVTYLNASTTRPSDSFPGLTGIVSGGTPRTAGAFYDVAYDRVLAPPAQTTGNGVAGGTCTPNQPNGTRTEYEEGIDYDQTRIDGGGDSGFASIDPARLIRDPYHDCAPVYPWNFVRTNTIFGVIHKAGGFAAWSDKHPAYTSVAGPGNGSNLDDFYGPEINSNVLSNSLNVTTPEGLACNPVPDPNLSASSQYTDSFQEIMCYDTLKVNAIINEINGETLRGNAAAPVPAIFGMNFQAVSVGQKLIEKVKGGGSSIVGGYLDAAGTPSGPLTSEIKFADDSIGEMVAALKKNHLLDSTLIVITAKHGQSPIDPNRYLGVPGPSGSANSPVTILDNLNLGLIPYSESPNNPSGIGPTEDDVSLIWLNNTNQTDLAVSTLEQPANASQAGIGQIFYGPSLTTMFNAPGFPAYTGMQPVGDPRTPDVIVAPNYGIVYTGSSKKQAEHGGFSHDDSNVMMLLSNPSIRQSVVNTPVETTQVAPTILQVLGLDPNQLDAVRLEGTPVLPTVQLPAGH
jgi:Type I phosphodiesterase / nucleotide pyrophosphatase